MQNFSQEQLKQFIEQIERLEEDKRNVATDIKDKYLEAKGQGFDTKIMRKVVRDRRKSSAERQEEEYLLDTYLHALGMLPDDESK